MTEPPTRTSQPGRLSPKEPLGTGLGTRAKENAAIARERERDELDRKRAELQLKLFPNWPDDRRGAPNTVIRAAVFGVVRRGRRIRVADLPIAAPEGWSVTLTGWRLDQSDCDLWLEVMHLARATKPGESLRFTLHTMLRRLGRKGDGGEDRRWLFRRLKGLTETTLSFESERFVGSSGSLLGSFRIDKRSGEAVIQTNPEVRSLFESVTHLDVERRRSLGGNQLAKAMHAMLSSHADWLPMKIETVMRRVGADYAQVKFFRRDLKAILLDFERRGWIDAWEIKDGDLLHIALRPSPTQLRLLSRHREAPVEG